MGRVAADSATLRLRDVALPGHAKISRTVLVAPKSPSYGPCTCRNELSAGIGNGERRRRTTRPAALGHTGERMDYTADWTAAASCRRTDPDALFVQGAAQNQAKVV